jgi:hypothetical protein
MRGRGIGLGFGFEEGGFEEVAFAFEDVAVARGYAGDGDGEQVADAGDRGGTIPCGKFGEGEVPRAEAGDVGCSAHGDEGVACVERAVALVEITEVAGRVAWRGKAAEGAEEFAFVEEVGGGGFSAREVHLHAGFAVLAGEWVEILQRRLREHEGFALRDGDGRRVGDGGGEGIEGADVVGVRVGEEKASDRTGIKGAGGCDDLGGGAGDHGVDESEAVGLLYEVAVDQAEAGELVGVGGDAGDVHGGSGA